MTNEQFRPLRADDLDPDPIQQFGRWLQEAEQAKIAQPEAMTLATADRHNRPAARIVLLRGVDERGFVFFTNYESRKGQDLRDNAKAALVFWWQPLSRQVRVEGTVELVEALESDHYFARRPRGHQLSAHASFQSRVIQDRLSLEEQVERVTHQFTKQTVPRPEYWGGYRVVPEVLEFWQEGEHRIHDRLRYRRDDRGKWGLERLAP
jgi:pyridoxamine 5'-phosphate oxidase